jgi:hypothetical protein
MQVTRWVRLALATGVSALSVGALAGPAVASDHHDATGYEFHTINNNNDPTFNQLLGINNRGVIAGYFGSGAQVTRTRATAYSAVLSSLNT